MEKIRIVIADDNRDFINILQEFINRQMIWKLWNS